MKKKTSTVSNQEKRDPSPKDRSQKLPKIRELKILRDEDLIIVTGGIGTPTAVDQI